MRALWKSFGIIPLFALALCAGARADDTHEHHAAGAPPEHLGKVTFPVTCGPGTQAKFERATALLHSFWYGEAEKAFTEIAATDAKCAMAHWGVAMTQFHPVWAAGNPAGEPKPAEIEKGRAAIQKAMAAKPKADRERDYIMAVEAFYHEPGPGAYTTRALAFENAMEKMHARYPDDHEAAIFYALALLGNAPASDKTYARQKKAAEILNRVLPSTPEHPGVAHYLIHSFDYPQLAELALPAARVYSKIAPSAPHALHMPSHIFTRLALWDESIESNLASAETAKRHVEKTLPGAAAFDQLHALDYLAYAYLQQARDDKAQEVLAAIAGVEKLDQDQFAAAYALAAVPARLALERRRWSDAAALTVRPAAFPWARFPYAEAITHFARAVGGARGGDLAAAKSGLERLEAILAALVERKDAYWAGQVEIQSLAGKAWIARAEGRNEEAVRLMRAAADLEESTEKHPVTPGYVLPAPEMLGDLLLDLGDAPGALREYERSLATTPGRFNSLAGAIRAAERGGDTAKAKQLYATLQGICARSDGSRPELVELRAAHSATR